MPITVQHSPPPLHQPGDVTKRPKGILKNPSFSGPSGPTGHQPASPTFASNPFASPTPFDPNESKELTLQNTLQNAGPRRRSSSTGRRHSAARRHSSTSTRDNENGDQDADKARLTWDEANLYLAEQDKGTRMKITEPKTPYEHARALPPEDEEEEEDVSIDPKFVAVDEVEMAQGRKKSRQRSRDSEIPGLELGEPEEDYTTALAAEDESSRIVRSSLSRETSQGSNVSRGEKHVSVSDGGDEDIGAGIGAEGHVGMPSKEEMEKHRQFEARRKRHYEMKDIKGLLGHMDEMDEDDNEDAAVTGKASLPSRGVNGTR